MPATPVIEVMGLVRKFGNFIAVDGVNFSVNQGEVFGFLGPNGAGKSTTIKVLCTLLKPTAGKCYVCGHDVEFAPGDVRSSIGIVFQDYTLDNYLTAQQNLAYHCKIYHVPRNEREKRIERVLELVDLSDRRYDLVRNFSGGMKRRLEIARGLLHHPRVLILDEPTVGLDPQTRRYVWDHIHELRRSHDITIFLTTHYMDEAENCQRIAIIDQGKIIALDSPEELKRQVSADIITLSTDDDITSMEEIQRIFGLRVIQQPQGLTIEVENGEDFLPILIENLPKKIKHISVRHPSLDDVFLNMTGKAIREEDVSSRQRMQEIIRAKGRMRR